MKKYAQFLLPAFIFSWIVLTVAVDFIAIPTVFRTLKDANLGGSIGIELFPKVNIVELILAIGLLISIKASINLKTRIFDRFVLVIGFFLFLLCLFFSTFLSPEIKKLTLMMMESKGNYSVLPALSVQHQFYHHLYIKLEGVKLVLLLVLMGWGIHLKKNNHL